MKLKTNGSSQSPPRLAYKIKEAAEALGVAPITVRRLINRKLIRSTKALRHTLIPAEELTRFLGQQETQSSLGSPIPSMDSRNARKNAGPKVSMKRVASLKEIAPFRERVAAFNAEKAAGCSHSDKTKDQTNDD
jgi:excisionase family DNA binding protein